MPVVFGPVLRSEGGYGYQSFAPDGGMNQGVAYRRIEDAIYAQRVERSTDDVACRTMEEFVACLDRLRTLPA